MVDNDTVMKDTVAFRDYNEGPIDDMDEDDDNDNKRSR